MQLMTPYYADDWLTVYHGDCRAVMRTLPAESVHCVVTSPPYWGLRDYGVDDQLGLEATPEAFVAAMVDVFREVRRVLRSDGTVWLNLGDSYAAQRGGTTMPAETLAGGEGGWMPDGSRVNRDRHDGYSPTRHASAIGLKHKDLVGIPWRVAFALQADGWYLRSDIIWAKPNPMPESVTDRPTKSHEYVFLLAKSPRYYFDADAVREDARYGYSETTRGDMWAQVGSAKRDPQRGGKTNIAGDGGNRNIRSVWTIATAPYPGAHFATFPPKLVEPCIKAGTSERGVCPECGAPWTRIVERGEVVYAGTNYRPERGKHETGDAAAQKYYGDGAMVPGGMRPATTTGWQPSCGHDGELVPATVLDCFAGSGTTGMVAQSLSRRAVLIDLSMDYLEQLMERNRDIPLGLGA